MSPLPAKQTSEACVEQELSEKAEVTPEQAVHLINNHYSRIFGQHIRYETPASVREKIEEIESTLKFSQRGGLAWLMKVGTITQYRRVLQLLERRPAR